jgi:hypothetical protein
MAVKEKTMIPSGSSLSLAHLASGPIVPNETEKQKHDDAIPHEVREALRIYRENPQDQKQREKVAERVETFLIEN